MSPLARSLLALACAALLHAACAQYYPTKCTRKARGINGSKIEFPVISINASEGRKICFDTRDENLNKDVFENNYELVGLSALACDWFVEPGLEISKDLTSICVYRGKYLEPDATLVIWEFCLPKRPPLGATRPL